MGLIIYILGLAIGLFLLLVLGVFLTPLFASMLWIIAFILITGVVLAVWEIIKPNKIVITDSTKVRHIQTEIAAIRRLGRKSY